MTLTETLKPIEPRAALGDALKKLGGEFPRLLVLSPDVSQSTKATKFKAAYPERFVCTGIAEQNTIGMAAGLSTMGWIPVVAAYAMFVAGKAWEPIRNSIAYPNFNVKIVATHAGINVGPDGVTHQCIEDLALMRAIPRMTVLAPTDAYEVEPALRLALEIDGPVYIRLERAAVPMLTDPNAPVTIGRALTLRQGSDVTLIGVSGMASRAVEAAGLLASEGVQARVLSMVSVKPLDEEAVTSAARETGAIVTAEDHNRFGGLGGAVAEILARTFPCPLEQVAVGDTFAESGSSQALYAKYGLTVEDIVRAAKAAMARRSPVWSAA